MDPLKFVKPGDRLQIPAEAWNALMDTVHKFRRRTPVAKAGEPGVTLGSGEVWIRNDSGGALDAFSVVGMDVSVLLASDSADTFKFNRPVIAGVTPKLSDDSPFLASGIAPNSWARFAVLQEPIASGACGLAMVAGVTPIQLDVIDATDEWADVINGDASKLRTGPSGSSRIVWKESGTGTKYGLVQLGCGQDEVAYKITGTEEWDSIYTGVAKLGRFSEVGPSLLYSQMPYMLADGCPCVVVHLDLVSGHPAQVPSFGLGRFMGWSNESPPRAVIFTNNITPKYSTAAVSGSGSWGRNGQCLGGTIDAPFTFSVITSIVPGGSTGQLTVGKKTIAIDSTGRPVSITEETTTTITVPP